MQGDENTDRKYNHSVQKKGSYNNNNITFKNMPAKDQTRPKWPAYEI